MARSADSLTRRALRRLGETLRGRYTINRLIGVGGMAAVYAGVHRNGHPVAIKILHERMASDPEIERLFRREAQLANTIGHPAVVPVIDDDVTEDGCVFLVMPLLAGETLRARAERHQDGKLPVAEVLVVAQAVLEALAAAHAKKIVHRDIKPENIFVTAEGEIRLLDFGIGRFFETGDSLTATKSGRALGTPAFMAPEQALGQLREIDGQTDIWAAGATMFSLLSGRAVHEGSSPTEVAIRAATMPAVPLHTVAPHAPIPVGEVVDRALAFKKTERWANAQSMANALRSTTDTDLGTSLPKYAPGPLDAHAFSSEGSSETQAPSDSRGRSSAATPTITLTTEAPLEETRTRGDSPTAKQRGYRLRFLVALGIIAAIAGTSLFALRAHFKAQRAPTPVTSSKPPPKDLFALLQPPSNGAALLDYRAATQLWHDGSSWDAITAFARAAKESPDFAAAMLWEVIAGNYVDGDVRAAYAQASLYRAALTDPQIELLDALGPSLRDPPDLSETTRRLAAMLRRRPDDIDLRLILAARYERLGDAEEGLPLAQFVATRSKPPPLSLLQRALFLLTEDKADAARADLQQCIDDSPTSNDCIYLLLTLDTNEGHCDRLEPTCRTLLSRNPNSFMGYGCIANSLFSSNHSLESIRAAYTSKYNLLSQSPALPALRAADEVDLAIATGHLESALRLENTWQKLSVSHELAEAYTFATALSIELREVSRAKHFAREFVDVAASWPQSDFVDVDAVGGFLRSLSGDMTAEERGLLRSRLRENISASASYGPPSRRWYNAYATTSWTHDEASEAVAKMPPDALFAPQYRLAEDDYLYGRLFALAGDLARARISFRRGAHSCSIHEDIYRTQSKAALAALLDDSDEEKCALYTDVAQHWQASPESVTYRTASSESARLSCKRPTHDARR